MNWHSMVCPNCVIWRYVSLDAYVAYGIVYRAWLTMFDVEGSLQWLMSKAAYNGCWLMLP